MNKIGFDNEKYVSTQSEQIKKRIASFGGKLYLEFGGKLFDDYHASRVLPGFLPDSKMKMLMQLKDQAEVVIVINANDIEKNKIRGDLGINYADDTLRLVDVFRSHGLFVGSVVLTQFAGQSSAVKFENRLQKLGIKTYRHYPIDGYPANVEHIVSDEGFGKNDYIETSHSLVVITASGPGSGKMATCLSQLYHENKRGIQAGYAKFETFPVWNLPLNHPVNIAYEAATADLNDVNMIDPWHLQAYGKTTVNYNRDVEIFPVLEAMFKKIYADCPYKSPTDMGVNMAGYCIMDDEAVQYAAKQEIIRRYYTALCEQANGTANTDEVFKLELLMNKVGCTVNDRPPVTPALALAEKTGEPACAIELNDGQIVTGKTSALLGACSAALLNALKAATGIDDEVLLISPQVIEPVQKLKTEHLGNKNPRLHTDEVLVALSISAVTDENAKKALDGLKDLDGCELHASVILSPTDEKVLRKLGIRLTSEPVYQSTSLCINKKV